MDFKDWRKASSEASPQERGTTTNRYHGQRFANYIEEQIREAEERGAFRNLAGLGQPLKLEANPYAGEKELSYSLLKNNGCLPAEIELAREISRELEQLETRQAVLSRRGRDLRRRRIAPFPSERRAYNASVAKALADHETGLRELNRKILTLNLSTPASMHRVPLDVEQLVREFRASCPLFT